MEARAEAGIKVKGPKHGNHPLGGANHGDYPKKIIAKPSLYIKICLVYMTWGEGRPLLVPLAPAFMEGLLAIGGNLYHVSLVFCTWTCNCLMLHIFVLSS